MDLTGALFTATLVAVFCYAVNRSLYDFMDFTTLRTFID